jgi:hypothetical protein
MQTLYVESYDADIKPNITGTYEKIQIRKPSLPKVAKVIRQPQKGHRKWHTFFQVKDENSNIIFTDAKEGVAIAKAKSLAKANIKSYDVCITKLLVNADPKVAFVSPSKSKPGKYKFMIIEKAA